MNRPALSRLSVILSACCLFACGNTGAPPRDYGPVLAKLSEQVILPEHQAFASRADELASSLQALVDSPDADTLTNAQVVMGGTANACNVYWKTSAAATVTDSSFVGTLLSGAAATMTRGNWTGRALATTNVTLTDPTPLTGCAAAAGAPGVTGVPTLSEWSMVALALLLGFAAFATKRRPWRASR